MNINNKQGNTPISKLFYRGAHKNNMSLLSLVLLFAVSLANAQAAENNYLKSDKVSDRFGLVADAGNAQPGPAVMASTTDSEWKLYAEQWELTRSGDSILSLPPLKQVINQWLTDRSKRIVLQYPGGEEGEYWVQELGDWLVAMGIPSRQIDLMVGSGADDMIRFNLMK